MSAEIIPVNVLREYRSLPKHSRGKRILEDIARREKTARLVAELQVDKLMAEWADSFFVTRAEVE